MNFSSDNWAGVHPAISAHLSAHAEGFDPAYGSGELDRRVGQRFNDIFEREVSVFFVGTGTAANSLSLALSARPGSLAFCHRQAHVMEDECGAPEFLTGGSRLHGVDGPDGRMNVAALEAAIGRFVPANVHSGRAAAVSVTQATEAGTVYGLDDISAIGALARANGLTLHMDGARFANALVALDSTPAAMTWKQGVDVLSFGGTKNGCWCAEAIVLFDTAKAEEMSFIRKRSAQLFSKSRFIAAQFEAYFEQGLWLETARHANAMAFMLADLIRASSKARLAWEPGANEVFAIMKRSDMKAAHMAGAAFYPWQRPHGFAQPMDEDETICRMVTSFATTPDEVMRFGDLIA